MKKQKLQNHKAQSFGKGLKLIKTVISNLDVPEMNNRNGGSGYWCSQGCHFPHKTYNCTQKNANTCAGHNTCAYPCV